MKYYLRLNDAMRSFREQRRLITDRTDPSKVLFYSRPSTNLTLDAVVDDSSTALLRLRIACGQEPVLKMRDTPITAKPSS